VSAPAASAAANPYTPAEACTNDFGGSWSLASEYYAAVKGTANHHCVQYQSFISRTANGAGAYAKGARYTWGNCT
jgi:hypothetical protein